MDLELKNVSVYSKDLYWILKALVQLEKEFESEEWVFVKPSDPQKYFDDVVFHRVIDDFVTQAGDPTCKTIGIYPATSLECGSGGTGETVDMEHNENLSHVDGAIGMARSQDPDSADSQWYIAETEAHGLDPENREDEGYVTFGIVRNGMSHVRAIATVPTTDDPSGEEVVVNPASSAGRPIWEVHISNVEMIGVIPYADEEPSEDETQSSLATTAGKVTVSIVLIGLGVAGYVFYAGNRIDEPDAILLDDES